MDVRFLDELDRKEIEGINDISKQEIITNSNSNKDEIIGVNSKAKNEILQKIESTKEIDLFDYGLYQSDYQLSKDYTINGDIKPLIISIGGSSVDITLDGVKRSTSSVSSDTDLRVVLMSYDMFKKTYQPNLKIPYCFKPTYNEPVVSEEHIANFSIKVVDSFKDLPNWFARRELYLIKNFDGSSLRIASGYSNEDMTLYCEYILK